MSELHKALGDISSIRRQVAGSTQFRGYGPATLAATGAMALLAAWAQSVWLPDAAHHVLAYLRLWGGVAVLSLALTGAQMYLRSRRIHSGLSDEMIRMAVEQFLPAIGAGLLVTIVLTRFRADECWMIPGLLQIVFSLGIFSSTRFLPRSMLAAGAWYMTTGLVCVALGPNKAFAPWTMGLAFGLGQGLVALVLLLSTPEDSDENEEA
jgi:hypothetical protein